MENQYKQQKKSGCNYESAQFDHTSNTNSRWCIVGNRYIFYNAFGEQSGGGELNRKSKEIDRYYYGTYKSTISKKKVEGNELVSYSCKGDTSEVNFECDGPVNRRVIGIRRNPLNQATKKFRQKDYSGAIKDLSLSLQFEPNNHLFLMLRSEAKFELKNYSGALEDITKAIEIEPSNHISYFARGMIHYYLNKFIEAKKDFTRAIKLNKDKETLFTAYKWRADTNLYNLRNYNDAKTDYSYLINLYPDRADGYEGRARVYFKQNKFSESKLDFLKAINIEPKNSSLFYGIANVGYQQKDYLGAIEDLTKAIRIDPQISKYYAVRGVAKYKLENHMGAIDDLNLAIQIDPNGRYFKARSDVWKAMGMHQNKCEDYQKYLSLTENHRFKWWSKLKRRC